MMMLLLLLLLHTDTEQLGPDTERPGPGTERLGPAPPTIQFSGPGEPWREASQLRRRVRPGLGWANFEAPVAQRAGAGAGGCLSDLAMAQAWAAEASLLQPVERLPGTVRRHVRWPPLPQSSKSRSNFESRIPVTARIMAP